MPAATRVTILTTGGTIASRQHGEDVVASDGPEALLGPTGRYDADLTVREVMRTGSYALTEAQLRLIAREATAAAREADGVVVTHGTDTMEETAFLTDLIHDGAAPIVFTGAQRPADAPDPDGPGNLADAVRFAADPALRGAGVVIGFAGTAWPARHATKIHTLDVDGFSAPTGEPVARCVDGVVSLVSKPDRPAAFPTAVLDAPLPRVDLVTAYAGADGSQIRAALEAGADGIVVAGFGSGNVTPAMAVEIQAAIDRRVPVVIATRVGAGPVVPRYGGPGGGTELRRAGAIGAGNLRPAHARLVLALALAETDDLDAVRTRVLRHGRVDAAGASS